MMWIKHFLSGLCARPVFTTHGSGLDTRIHAHSVRPRQIIQLGYLSRFDESKGSHEVLKAAQNLPDDRHLIIAGWDIKGKRYSKKFRELAQEKSNVTFLGRLHSRAEISKFFNSLDLFLSPSVREGGNIALQEAIWHGVPFLTTDAPGCQLLADRFGCQAVKMNEFSKAVLSPSCINTQIKTNDWCEKIKPFSVPNVSKEYEFILKQVLNAQRLASS